MQGLKNLWYKPLLGQMLSSKESIIIRHMNQANVEAKLIAKTKQFNENIGKWIKLKMIT